ncbi:Cro/Cl family transcriptional regulator [Erysipelothrix larvae]|uniref:Cro/Cl family transcriptional regulator n=1 Tax=Erysipelothrix larvae TaxID=1514105 RepID=A0A0X8H157_9FIRM|nr:XRE family transcriptional regulator [Erysipelothrix larvae]AMC94194.1 Cro/Cl family transcriptional regulator [Erysipelothrix larvae]
MEIGKKIKRYRIQNGLTLEELASRCELSKGFLSQLENDLTSPSIATLSDIVEALGMDLSRFFEEESSEQIVFKKDDFFVDERENSKIHWIVPNAQKNEMEPILLELGQGAESNEIAPHEGEEFGYVLMGKVTLVYGDESYVIKKGQTFYIKGNKGHLLRNDYPQQVQVLWVCTPPVF